MLKRTNPQRTTAYLVIGFFQQTATKNVWRRVDTLLVPAGSAGSDQDGHKRRMQARARPCGTRGGEEMYYRIMVFYTNGTGNLDLL